MIVLSNKQMNTTMLSFGALFLVFAGHVSV